MIDGRPQQHSAMMLKALLVLLINEEFKFQELLLHFLSFFVPCVPLRVRRHHQRLNRARKERRIIIQKPQKPRRRQAIAAYFSQIYNRTGVYPDDFESLFKRIENRISMARMTTKKGISTSLDGRSRLLLVLQWLHEYLFYRVLADQYGISKTQVFREIRHIVPILYQEIREIELPLVWPSWDFSHIGAIHGVIDSTPCFRERVHPGQALYYRGDKHAHFLNVQLIVAPDGRIYNVAITLGHNNDQGSFKLTGVDQLVEASELYFAADRGYHHYRLIIPTPSCSDRWNNQQKSVRSIVEVVIGLGKTWEALNQKFREPPEIQVMVILTVFHLLQLKLKQFPLRFLVDL